VLQTGQAASAFISLIWRKSSNFDLHTGQKYSYIGILYLYLNFNPPLFQSQNITAYFDRMLPEIYTELSQIRQVVNKMDNKQLATNC
jgi:hypothetical protein